MADTADLKVVVEADVLIDPHVFTVNVSNLGPDTGRNPQLTVVLISDSFTVVAVTATGSPTIEPSGLPKTATTHILVWGWDEIPAGETFVCTIEISQDFTEPTNVSITGDISTDSTDPDSSNNQHEITVTLAMATLTKGVIKALQSHLTSSGYTGVVEIGEPQKPPPGWHASITLLSYGVKPGEETTLNKSIERRVVTISIRRPVVAGTPEETEIKMDEVMVDLHSKLLGDFTLDGKVRNIEALSVDFLYEQIPTGGAEYRTGRMTVPFIVDDSATYAP